MLSISFKNYSSTFGEQCVYTGLLIKAALQAEIFTKQSEAFIEAGF